MKIILTEYCLPDSETTRTKNLLLVAECFQEERALTFLKNALLDGRAVTAELPGDEEYTFTVSCSPVEDFS